MKPDGGNVPQRARMICPYFDTFTMERRAIVCESGIKGTKIALMFRTREDMERYSERNCETYRYNRCPYANMLGLKYAQMDEK